MRRFDQHSLRSVARATFATIFTIVAGQASAHVKWFCAFDIAGQPVGLENVLCPDFEVLVGFATLLMVAAALLEGTAFGAALLRATGRALQPLETQSDVLIRAVGGFFFVSLWAIGGILLTPELKTTSPLIPFLHLTIAAGLLWRQTLIVSALGIVTLFAVALHDYGTFHLMDYPIFLGFAGYLALTALRWTPWGVRPLDVARWATAITLMWASVEKWAYPAWSFPLFVTHPQVGMGFEPEFFMRAAGVVEFALSFALIWTPLFRRVSGLILAGMFLAAIAPFGKLDAVGHAPIIALVLAIVADGSSAPVAVRRPVAWLPVGFAAALTGFILAYYVLHATMFGTTLT